MFVYIGTYSKEESLGIYVYDFDVATGKLAFTGQSAQTANPSFLALHPNGSYLYAVNEVGDLNGKPGGGVSAFAIDAQTGGLSFLNQQSSGGAAPCYVTVDATGHLLLVANYSGGSIAALPIQAADGRLQEAASFFQHPHEANQTKAPHAHSVTLDAANRFVLAADLGLDRIYTYRLDDAKSHLEAGPIPFAPVHGGAGPRHFAFHPSGRFAYSLNELDSTLSLFTYDAATGALKEMNHLSTLPADFKGHNSCADLHLHPSGAFLYSSNRGHDSIAIFALDKVTAQPTLVGHQPSGGRTPRNFAIDPLGNYLLAANQDSNNITVFRIDAASGRLSETGQVVAIPSPVCIRFRPQHN